MTPASVVFMLVVLIPLLAPTDALAGGDQPGDVASAGREVGEELEGPHLQVGAQIFGGWLSQWRADDDFNAFEIDRAELQTRWRPTPNVHAALTTEVVRAAGPRGFFGVDGDSLVVRLKHAWGAFSGDLGPVSLEGRAGLVPDIWVEALEADYGLRALAPTLSEAGGFFDTSDLGTSLKAAVFDDRIQLAVALTNGQGRGHREQNRGKNVTARLTAELWRSDSGARAALHVGARDGSLGVASVPDHRLAAGASWSSRRASAGVEWITARGFAADAARDSTGWAAWAQAAPLARLPGVALRADRHDTDSRADHADRTWVRAGLFHDLIAAEQVDRLRLYVAYAHASAGDDAAPLPGVPDAADEHRLSVTLDIDVHHFLE